MDLQWIGTAVVAIVGFLGVLWTQRHASVLADRQRAFEKEQAEAEVKRQERERIYQGVASVQTLLQKAESLATADTIPEMGDPDFYDPDGFGDWWNRNRPEVRSKVALIQEAAIRASLDAVLDTIDDRDNLASWTWVGDARTLVRNTAQVGFQITSAWLRGEPGQYDEGTDKKLETMVDALESWEDHLEAQIEANREARREAIDREYLHGADE